jgi:metal-responsive CopG/Arc/MetJ family transcriptional regulator
MKTAISLPDQLFLSAEEVADKMGIARSQLFARALEEFIKNHSEINVTEKLNEVYRIQSSEIDPVIQEMQTISLEKGLINDSW